MTGQTPKLTIRLRRWAERSCGGVLRNGEKSCGWAEPLVGWAGGGGAEPRVGGRGRRRAEPRVGGAAGGCAESRGWRAEPAAGPDLERMLEPGVSPGVPPHATRLGRCDSQVTFREGSLPRGAPQGTKIRVLLRVREETTHG